MKRLIVASAIISVFALGTVPANVARAEASAQPGSEAGSGNATAVKGAKDKRIQRLIAALGLTDDQVRKVKAVYKAQQAKIAIAKSDPSVSPDDKRARLANIKRDTRQQIDAILTPEQQLKLRQAQKARREALGGRTAKDAAPGQDTQGGAANPAP